MVTSAADTAAMRAAATIVERILIVEVFVFGNSRLDYGACDVVGLKRADGLR
jgi:hypothetical protein